MAITTKRNIEVEIVGSREENGGVIVEILFPQTGKTGERRLEDLVAPGGEKEIKAAIKAAAENAPAKKARRANGGAKRVRTEGQNFNETGAKFSAFGLSGCALVRYLGSLKLSSDVRLAVLEKAGITVSVGTFRRQSWLGATDPSCVPPVRKDTRETLSEMIDKAESRVAKGTPAKTATESEPKATAKAKPPSKKASTPKKLKK